MSEIIFYAWGHPDVRDLFKEAVAVLGTEGFGTTHGVWGESCYHTVSSIDTVDAAFSLLAAAGCGVSLYQDSPGPDLPRVIKIQYPTMPTNQATCRLCGSEDDHALVFKSMGGPGMPVCRKCDAKIMVGPMVSKYRLDWWCRKVETACEECNAMIRVTYDRWSGHFRSGPEGLAMPQCSSAGVTQGGLHFINDQVSLLCHRCYTKAKGDFLTSPVVYDEIGDLPDRRWVWCHHCQAFTAIIVSDPSTVTGWREARCKGCGRQATDIWYGHGDCGDFAVMNAGFSDIYCPECHLRLYGGTSTALKPCKAEGCDRLPSTLDYCENHWQEEALHRFREYDRVTPHTWRVQPMRDGNPFEIEQCKRIKVAIQNLSLEQAVRQGLIAICSPDKGIFDNRKRWVGEGDLYVQFFLWTALPHENGHLVCGRRPSPSVPRQEILDMMDELRQRDKKDGITSTIVCEVCGQEKPAAGTIVYDVTTYCNDCATQRELEMAGYQVGPAFG